MQFLPNLVFDPSFVRSGVNLTTPHPLEHGQNSRK
jgi:hypothetical protein